MDSDGAHAFTHDLADRLTSATHPVASGLPAESFAYDQVGNRTSWTGPVDAWDAWGGAGPISVVSLAAGHE
jgi:hypothetical protein